MSHLHVSNLSPATDDRALFRAFQRGVGGVRTARVARCGDDGAYGFVSFAGEERAWLATQSMAGATIDGRAVRLAVVRGAAGGVAVAVAEGVKRAGEKEGKGEGEAVGEAEAEGAETAHGKGKGKGAEASRMGSGAGGGGGGVVGGAAGRVLSVGHEM